MAYEQRVWHSCRTTFMKCVKCFERDWILLRQHIFAKIKNTQTNLAKWLAAVVNVDEFAIVFVKQQALYTYVKCSINSLLWQFITVRAAETSA